MFQWAHKLIKDHQLPFVLEPTHKQPPPGNLNFICLVKNQTGNLLLLRKTNPQGFKKELPFITQELIGVEFHQHQGNGFKVRSLLDQVKFSQLLIKAGLPVPSIKYLAPQVQAISYYPGLTPLAKLLPTNEALALKSIPKFLKLLAVAHDQGLVLGDRWGYNELVAASGQVYLIDFDIELFGPDAKEFEIAMFIFFCGFFAQNLNFKSFTMLVTIFASFISDQKQYQGKQIKTFIKNFFSYFSSKTAVYYWKNKTAQNYFISNI